MDLIKIGKFIANCRKEKNITQEQLAEKLFITDRAVSKWERGLSLPDADKMLDLCNILDINVNELLNGERIDMKDYEKKKRAGRNPQFHFSDIGLKEEDLDYWKA